MCDAAVILGLFTQVFGDGHELEPERRILDLDEQPLPFRFDKAQIGTQVVNT